MAATTYIEVISGWEYPHNIVKNDVFTKVRNIRRRIYGFAVLVRIAKRKLSRLREILTAGSTLPLRHLSN